MPADRDPHTAFGQPPGLWPGQDISHQPDSLTLPWPDARAAPPAPAQVHDDLPWPERELPGQGHPAQPWTDADQGWPGYDPVGVDRASRAAGPASGRGPSAGPAFDDGTGWTGSPEGTGPGPDWGPPAGPTPHEGAGWGPHEGAGWGGPVDGAGRGEAATTTATLTDPRTRPGVGGPGQPPPPPVAPGPPPGGARGRGRMVLAAAVALAMVGGGVAVAALRPDATNPQAGQVPTTAGPAPSAGLGAPAAPGAASPSAAQGLGGKPAVKPSASASANANGFSGTRLTLPGASVDPQNGETFSQALSRSDRTIGRLRMARVFYPGLPPAWDGSRSDMVDRTVVVSFKAPPQEINAGKYDARLTSWFASIPRDHDVYWAYFHEPEDDVERGSFTAAQYKQAWRRIAGMANRANNPKLINTVILMCWTVDPKSGRSFDAFYPGSDLVETIGWDCYNWAVKWKRYAPPTEVFDRMVDKSRALGKPWGLAETGSDLLPGDAGTGRAAWIRSMTSYINGKRPEFVAYWNNAVSYGDFRLLDQPSIQAWKSFCVA
ncbi:hypothetical protein [Micromonospora humi]|uniref:GH26 domain-containing protein n=1 Tax=Micromonospora humi TaxID=745366 RepID=A0A1C5I848_9ACTN|nr:hypothetical protein [Micromonospora humi]SCG54365.1 hypothetical protein GA0070213_10563 [Micromonospora humi]